MIAEVLFLNSCQILFWMKRIAPVTYISSYLLLNNISGLQRQKRGPSVATKSDYVAVCHPSLWAFKDSST